MFISYCFFAGGVQWPSLRFWWLQFFVIPGAPGTIALPVIPFVLLIHFPPRSAPWQSRVFQMLLHSWCVYRRSLLIVSFSSFSLGFMESQNECWHCCFLSYIIFNTSFFVTFSILLLQFISNPAKLILQKVQLKQGVDMGLFEDKQKWIYTCASAATFYYHKCTYIFLWSGHV